jgi:transposase
MILSSKLLMPNRRVAPNFPSLRSLKKVWADMGYIGQPTRDMAQRFGCRLEIVKRSRQWFWVPARVRNVNAYLRSRGVSTSPGFKVLPRHWAVEHTFAWLAAIDD